MIVFHLFFIKLLLYVRQFRLQLLMRLLCFFPTGDGLFCCLPCLLRFLCRFLHHAFTRHQPAFTSASACHSPAGLKDIARQRHAAE